MLLDDDDGYLLMDWDFYAALLYTWAHWREDTVGPRSPLAVFNHVKSTCGIDLAIGGLEVRVDEMGTWEQYGASKHKQREKSLKVIFRDKDEDIFITVSFVLEKTMDNKSLQDLAAEAFARQMKTRGDIERLDIFTKTRTRNAKILVDRVLDKFRDMEWIRAHVNQELTTKQWKERYKTAEKTIEMLEEQLQKAAGRAERLDEELGDSRLVVVQHKAKVKILTETICEGDAKKRGLEEELDKLQEQVKKLKSAEQINAVVSEEQQKNANAKEALEEKLYQHREPHQNQVPRRRNEIKGKQGAMEELRCANQSLTLASKTLKAAAVPEEEEIAPEHGALSSGFLLPS